MEKKRVAVPLVCHGHSRPVVDLFYNPITPDGFFLICASKGMHFIYFISLILMLSFDEVDRDLVLFV